MPHNENSHILLLGAPGSGKTTLLNGLVEHIRFAAFDSGTMLRAMATPAQLDNLARGNMAPEEYIRDIVSRYLAEHPHRVVWSGFPRIVDVFHEGTNQPQFFDAALAAYGEGLRRVLYLECDKEVVLARIRARAAQEGRPEDADVAAMERRQLLFEASKNGLLEHYKPLVRTLRADQKPDDVLAEALAILEG